MNESIFGGANPVELRSGGALSCSYRFGEAQWVELARAGEPTQRIELRFPDAGIGGQELVVSSDERYAAMFVYSGQSEQGYELFELKPMLRHVRGVGYVQGKGDAPRFSPDGRWLVMLTTVVPMVRETEEYAEEVLGQGDTSGHDHVLVDWAELLIQEVPNGDPMTVAVGTSLPPGFDVDTFAEWTLHDAWQFSAADQVTVVLPWGGRLMIQLPPAGPVTTEAFSAKFG